MTSESLHGSSRGLGDIERAGDERTIEDLVAHYVGRLNDGERLDRERILSDHPDVGEEVLADLEAFLDLTPDATPAPLGALGDYTLVRQIGRGGMGVVYEAWEGSMDRAVALKVLPGAVAADSKAYMRFMREARTAGQLSHPSVVPVYAMGVNENTPYYAMELVEGETLAAVLAAVKDAGRESETVFGKKEDTRYFANLAEAFAEVADGLHHAHARGVVHRDVKPSNLILDRSGRLRILDFGLARLEGHESLTLAGDVVGTLLYLSPEQARRRKVEVDHRTDIYSLGATLYEAVVGHPPFRGKDHTDTLTQIIERDPVEPRKRNARVPRDLETIVLKCLSKHAADRYGTAEALAQDLRRFVRGDPIEARPEHEWERWARRAWAVRGRLAVAGLVVLLAGALAVLLVEHLAAQRARTERAYREEVIAGVMRVQLGELTVAGGAGRNTMISPEGLFREGDLDALAESAGLHLNPLEDGLVRLARATDLLPSRPDAYYHRARALELLGHRDEALAELERAVRADAEFVPAAAMRAELLGERARGTSPVGWRATWLRARDAAAAARWEEAADGYESLVASIGAGEGPYLGASIEFHLGLGGARFQLDQPLAALESFVAARTLWPEATEPWLLAGMIYLELGELTQASETFERLHARPGVLEDDVSLWVAALYKHYKRYREGLDWARRVENETIRLRLEASFSSMLGPPAETVRLCREALRRFPADQRFHHSLAVALLRVPGGLKEALAVARKAHEMAPQRADTTCLLAAALADSGEVEEAESLLRDVVASAPDEPRAYAQLGALHFGRKEIDGAERMFLRAIELVEADPHHHILDPMLDWGKRLVALGRIEEAVAMYERSIAASPTLPDTYANWGKLLKMAGEFDRAETMCRKALEVSPEKYEAQRDLGLVLWAKGEREEAVGALEAALALEPAYTYAHASLAWARDGLGQLEEAFEDCVRSIEAAPAVAWNHRRMIELQHRLAGDEPFAPRGWDRVVTALDARRKDGDASPSVLAVLVFARLHGDAARDPELALSLATLATESTERADPFLEVARASALFEAGRRPEAVRALESTLDASQVPGFVPEKLRQYRLDGLPAIASMASADSLLEEEGIDARELLIGARGATTTDSTVSVYLEARSLEREGRLEEATAALEALYRARSGSADAHLPALRLAECLESAGRTEKAAALLAEAIAAEPERVVLWERWFELASSALERPPLAIVAELPRAESRYGSQLRALLEDLDAGAAIRIDCGGEGFVDSHGHTWEADRFFRGGTIQPDAYVTLRGAADPRLFRSRRVFLSYEAFASYRVPVPRGRYRVAIHTAETLVNGALFPKKFHVELEGRRVLENIGPRGFSSATTFEVEGRVEDGVLELAFIAAEEHPAVSGIEVVRIE